jgi:hypothetical protein
VYAEVDERAGSLVVAGTTFVGLQPMLGWVVVAGVIVRFFTRARDRGKSRLWWVIIGIVSYMLPYILVDRVIGAGIGYTLGVPYDSEDLYFVLLIASIAAGLACSVFVMRAMIRGVPVIREDWSGPS